ncbi:MAG: hypothetical protein ACLFTQ_02750 [Candidatus Aenigmatarchaeota archaeon]
MKKIVLKEWEDRGTSKVKISFQNEERGMKEAILPREKVSEFLEESGWF